jgi:hypothetical protein
MSHLITKQMIGVRDVMLLEIKTSLTETDFGQPKFPESGVVV